MRRDMASLMSRRGFLLTTFGAFCAAGLAGCGQSSSKGSYDDGYSAGYAAGVADAEAEAKAGQGTEASSSSVPSSGIEYTINSASLEARQYSGAPVLVLEVTGKNVSDADKPVFFTGTQIAAYQDGKSLTDCSFVEGRDLPESRTIQAGASLDGWLGYELIDTTTPVELKAGNVAGTNYYGLSNPQTIDLGAL